MKRTVSRGFRFGSGFLRYRGLDIFRVKLMRYADAGRGPTFEITESSRFLGFEITRLHHKPKFRIVEFDIQYCSGYKEKMSGENRNERDLYFYQQRY